MDLRSIQQPLKQRYRDEPEAAVITLRAHADGATAPTACSVDIGRAVYEAEAQNRTTDHLIEQILENVPVP